MKVVYSNPSLALVAHFRAVLDSHGIACRIRNEHLAGAAGELPMLECWPQLCVADELEERALRAIREAQAPGGGERWRCAGCGERLEAQFTACWNCGRSRA